MNLSRHNYNTEHHESPYNQKIQDEDRAQADLLGTRWTAFLERTARDTGASPAALGLLQFCCRYMTDQHRAEGRRILAPVAAAAWSRRDLDAHAAATLGLADLDDCDGIAHRNTGAVQAIIDLLQEGPTTRRHLIAQMRRSGQPAFDCDHPIYRAMQDMGVIRVDSDGIVWPRLSPERLDALAASLGEGVR